jgi:predicted exporter
MRNLFQKTFSLLRGKRGILFAGVVFLAAVCVWRAGGMRMRESVLDMLPAREKSVDDFTAIVSRFGYQNRLFFDIEAGTNQADAGSAADKLYEALQKSGLFKSFIYRVNAEEGIAALDLVETHLPALFGQEEQDYVVSNLSRPKVEARLAQARQTLLEIPVTGPFSKTLGQDPLGIEGIFMTQLEGFQYGAKIEDGRIWSGDGKHILLIGIPHDENAAGQKGRDLLVSIEKARKVAMDAYPDTKIRYIGGLRITEDNRELMRRDITLTTTVSTLLVLVLSFVVYRRAILVLLSLIPVAFGGLFALGCCAFFSNEMSAIVAGFGGVLIGIAVDYAVYVLYRYDHFEGLSRDAESLNRHLSVIAAPIVMGAATTIAAFLCLLLSSLPGQRQLGVFAAIGIGGAALFSLVVLPQMLSQLPPTNKKPLLNLTNGLRSFFEWHRRHRGLGWGFVLAVSLAALGGISKVTFDGDLKKLSGMRTDTRADEVVISQQWEGQFFNKTLVVVRGATLEEARQKNDRLYPLLLQLEQEGAIEKFNSLSPLAPSLKTQEENENRWRAFWNPAHSVLVKRSLTEAGQKEGFSPSAFLPFIKSIHQKDDLLPGEALRGGAIGQLASGFISEQKGETLILTEVKAGSGYDALSALVLARMPDAMVYNGDAFTGHISALVIKVLWRFTWVSLAASLAILWIGYGRLDMVLIIAAALGLDAFWSLGLLGWLGIPINLMNNIFILFIFGMGADYAVFVVSAFLSASSDPDEEIGVAGGASVLAALTGIGAFGTLIVARHPALRSIGITATLVLTIGLVVAVVVIPLAMDVLLRKSGYRSGKNIG